MTDKNGEGKGKAEKENPELKDVGPGSDVDETPVAAPSETPPNPNEKPK